MSDYRLSPDEWRRVTDENKVRITDALEELERDYPFGFFADVNRWVTCERIDFRQMRADIDQVQGLFNELKLRRQDREELWDRFNKFRGSAREAQREYYAERERMLNENHARLYSAIHRLEMGHDLNWQADFLAFKKNLEGFWEDVAEIGQLFKECKPLRQDDREELWGWFQRLCQRVRELQHEAHEERDRAWRERQHELLDRWHALLDKNEGIIENIKGQIDRCEEIRDGAKTDDFAAEVQGWIDEKERKIDDIEESNQELWRKIRDVEAKLNG